jgi:hypothetical protein
MLSGVISCYQRLSNERGRISQAFAKKGLTSDRCWGKVLYLSSFELAFPGLIPGLIRYLLNLPLTAILASFRDGRTRPGLLVKRVAQRLSGGCVGEDSAVAFAASPVVTLRFCFPVGETVRWLVIMVRRPVSIVV